MTTGCSNDFRKGMVMGATEVVHFSVVDNRRWQLYPHLGFEAKTPRAAIVETDRAAAALPDHASTCNGITLRASTLIAWPLLCNCPSTTTNGDWSALRLAS